MIANKIMSNISTKKILNTQNESIKTYFSLEQLGLSGAITLTDLVKAMPNYSRYTNANCKSWGDYISDAPVDYGTLEVVKNGGMDYIYSLFVDTTDIKVNLYCCKYDSNHGGWTDWSLISNCLPLTGGTLNGELSLYDGRGKINYSSSALYLKYADSAEAMQNKTFRELGLYNSTTRTIDNALTLVNGVNASYTSYKIYGEHNVTISKSDLTAGSSALTTGCIYLVYS